MKKCPYCAEEIQDEAIKCRFCGSLLDQKQPVKWYLKTSILVISFLSIGPLALPLVWFNPRFSRNAKIIISIMVIILTYYLGIALANAIGKIMKYYQIILQPTINSINF